MSRSADRPAPPLGSGDHRRATMSLAITIRRALGERRLEVDLEIADGERLVVIGPNGAGKSSLLRSVAGLDP
ncbi:MAG: ATP-binding cassette domain-containing protein, partial [Ilumatobacteraceae bacterium]